MPVASMAVATVTTVPMMVMTLLDYEIDPLYLSQIFLGKNYLDTRQLANYCAESS